MPPDVHKRGFSLFTMKLSQLRELLTPKVGQKVAWTTPAGLQRTGTVVEIFLGQAVRILPDNGGFHVSLEVACFLPTACVTSPP
jgi:hypothetical protein